MTNQVRHVLGAVAQRRQAQRHDVEPVEKILAEKTLVDQDLEVLVGGGDNPHVGLDRGAAADRGVFALLQHAQQPGLGIHRHVADLVEEQGSALGLLETAGGLVLGAGKGALFVSEQFGFDQITGDGGHVDGDKRAVAALAVVVQRTRHQFLAGAGFAGDHQRQVGLHQPGQNPVDFLHGGRAADQRHALGGFLGLG